MITVPIAITSSFACQISSWVRYQTFGTVGTVIHLCPLTALELILQNYNILCEADDGMYFTSKIVKLLGDRVSNRTAAIDLPCAWECQAPLQILNKVAFLLVVASFSSQINDLENNGNNTRSCPRLKSAIVRGIASPSSSTRRMIRSCRPGSACGRGARCPAE